MKYLILLVAISIVLINKNSIAQDRHFSQIKNTMLMVNPASAGSFQGDYRASLHYRNQWASVSSPYKTTAANFDMGFMKKKVESGYFGIGALFYRDVAGDGNLGITKFDLALSYHQKINANNVFTAGLMGGYSQTGLNASNFQTDNQYDGSGFNSSYSSGETRSFASITNFDFGAGLQWKYSSSDASKMGNKGFILTGGGAVYHLNRPNYSFDNLVNKKQFSRIALHGNAFIAIKNHFALLPNLLYQKQGKLNEFVVGTHFRYILGDSKNEKLANNTALLVGIYDRINDAIIASVGVQHGSYSVEISYDLTTSNVSSAGNSVGGFEITLRYLNPNPFRSRKSSDNTRFL